MKTKEKTSKPVKAKEVRKTHWCYQIFYKTSLVNGKRLRCEAHLEPRKLLMLDFEPSVMDVETGFDSPMHEKVGRYTPDIRVIWRDRRVTYFEIKSDAGAEDEGFKQKFPLLQDEYSKKNLA